MPQVKDLDENKREYEPKGLFGAASSVMQNCRAEHDTEVEFFNLPALKPHLL